MLVLTDDVVEDKKTAYEIIQRVCENESALDPIILTTLLDKAVANLKELPGN